MTDAERAELLQQQRDHLLIAVDHLLAASNAGNQKYTDIAISQLVLAKMEINQSPSPYKAKPEHVWIIKKDTP